MVLELWLTIGLEFEYLLLLIPQSFLSHNYYSPCEGEYKLLEKLIA